MKKMENKYYTPSEQELIEHLINGETVYSKAYGDSPLVKITPSGNIPYLIDFIHENGCELDNKPYDLDESYFKIKYLDKSDIEELGWEYTGKEYHLDRIESKIVEGEKEYSGQQYRLYHNPSKNTVTIEKLGLNEFSGEPYYDLCEGNQNHIVKRIEVKNKSELKKLMKQLKIV